MKKVIIISLAILSVLITMGFCGAQLAWGDDITRIEFSKLPAFSKEQVENALAIPLSEKEKISHIEKTEYHTGPVKYTVAIRCDNVKAFTESNKALTDNLPQVSKDNIGAIGFYTEYNTLYISAFQLDYDDPSPEYSQYCDYAKKLINALTLAMEGDDGTRPKHYKPGEELRVKKDIEKSKQKDILNTLGIVIPEDETEAFVYSIGYREDSSYKNGFWKFAIEIGGIKDHKSFFEHNNHIKSENQSKGNYPYDNEMLGTDYYITYYKLYSNPTVKEIKEKDMLIEVFED